MSVIPSFDIRAQYQTLAAELNESVLSVLQSGHYIGGPVVKAFETQFAQYIGTEHAVSCNSGTDALYLALRALDIGPGDEVITAPFTFFATTEAISLTGATPVFVDIEPDYFNLDLNQLEAAISERTRAVLPVHLFGCPMDMTRLMAIAQANNLRVLEDCAQATGACWAGQKVGSIGDIGAFSFYPTKNLGACGDGGMMTTNDPELASRLRILKEHGSRERYFHESVGMNSRLDAMQAALLQVKLPHLDTWNVLRRGVAERYNQLLAPLEAVKQGTVKRPSAITGGMHVWNQYTIRVSQRDQVRTALQEQGIGTMVYYPVPLHLQAVYASLGYQPGSFPVAEQVCAEVLALPMFPELLSAQQDAVVYALKDVLSL
ncbi:aminotransferase class I/II-fold pyridoxal phosphate-dependent enzyme [Leptolyngbya sp. FACHB-261]|uniref:DegT/DnrJ/EryC1/StrS family aminotransferase n=1 Tax=Leptolyngbya sp. FACHB-261 TaxID=2692806 RepID=UPI001684DCCA|nr:aminotransferase class I/II-fold pyridoxal phosphate-dependent enzyme [Leptolyngbya sp. FACHB-261]MBD2103298.1 DegT/DnrJ/EryC1/StrS family aminotransferase [Leptolyngbya sp. FACHB-261]